MDDLQSMGISNSALTAEISAIKSQNSEMASQCKTSSNHIGVLESELADTRKSHYAVSEKLEREASLAALLNKQYNRVLADNIELESKLSVAETTLFGTIRDKTSLENLSTETKANELALQLELDATLAKLNQISSDLDKTKYHFSAQVEENEKLRKQLAEVDFSTQNFELSQITLEQHRKEISELKNTLADIQRAKDDRDAQYGILQRWYDLLLAETKIVSIY